MKQWLRRFLLRLEVKLRPKPVPRDPAMQALVHQLGDKLLEQQQVMDFDRRNYIERSAEMIEARQMCGAGPWLGEEARTTAGGKKLREAGVPIGAQGAFGELELALQNADWRREVNLSWMEFSRSGIQGIILISRLYYIKNPIIRRLINVDAYYVFGRGVEITSTNDAVNDAIKEFLHLNDAELGQVALSEHQKRTNYDGNLFFVFFPETQSSGVCPMRTIDATEIQDIICNPDDSNEEWFFRRTWTKRDFDEKSGAIATKNFEVWYPSCDYQPEVKLPEIGGISILWDQPVMHRKYGTVGNWLFGAPVIYPAIDWAKAARRYLEACATVAASHAQIAMTLSTKGGQQALAGVKQQLESTVGPQAQVWDTNPTPVNASIFASGPGTKLEAFHARGQGLDPSEVKQFATMAAICMDVPPTFLGDLDTANLATATTLDRPTELAFKHKQEAWREFLTKIILFALNTQVRAPGGKLREALNKNNDVGKFRFVEAPRHLLNGKALT